MIKSMYLTIKLKKLSNVLRTKNSAHETKEALNIVNDKLKELNLDGRTLPKDVTLGVLMEFLSTCALIYLNGGQLDKVLEMAQLFNQYSSDWDVNPRLRVSMGEIQAKAFIRKCNYSQAINIMDELEKIAFAPDDLFKVFYLKGVAQSRIDSLNINIDYLSKALAKAEEMGNKTYIANVYRQLSLVLSIRFPALGLSLLRTAERYYADCMDKCLMIENQLLIAQSCIIFDVMGILPKVDRVYFKNEGRHILNSIDFDSLLQDSNKALYNCIYGLTYDEVNKLWEAYSMYKSHGDLSEAAMVAESIAVVCSKNRDLREAIKGEQAHLALAQEMNNQIRKSHARRAIIYLSQGIPINFPNHTSYDEPRTLLHILNQISLEEELLYLKVKIQKLGQTYFNPMDYGKCLPLYDSDGKVILYPFCRNPFHYYRGQTKRFIPCKPSLFREGMNLSKQYLERVRYAEFHLLVDTHPICHEYIDFDKILRPNAKNPAQLKIYHLALAQHYGIATELIDLTADKWVAAFFAATDYVDGEYKVHTDKTEQGIFYKCVEPEYVERKTDNFVPKIKPIGIQPFSRPGEQCGLAYPMKQDEDFENVANESLTFIHNKQVNELIFNFTNRSKRLFPDDVLKEKADIIKESHLFSEAAYAMARRMFYPNIPQDVFDEWEEAEGMHHQDDPIIAFTQMEMDDYHKNLPAFMKKLSKNIIRINKRRTPIQNGKSSPYKTA